MAAADDRCAAASSSRPSLQATFPRCARSLSHGGDRLCSRPRCPDRYRDASYTAAKETAGRHRDWRPAPSSRKPDLGRAAQAHLRRALIDAASKAYESVTHKEAGLSRQASCYPPTQRAGPDARGLSPISSLAKAPAACVASAPLSTMRADTESAEGYRAGLQRKSGGLARPPRSLAALGGPLRPRSMRAFAAAAFQSG